MVKHTQTIRRQQPTNFLSVFGYFAGLALKGLIILLNVSVLYSERFLTFEIKFVIFKRFYGILAIALWRSNFPNHLTYFWLLAK